MVTSWPRRLSSSRSMSESISEMRELVTEGRYLSAS
jgi:hypothetical protein